MHWSMREKWGAGSSRLYLPLVSKSPAPSWARGLSRSPVTSPSSSQASPTKLGREEPSGHPSCQQGSGEQRGSCHAWECPVSTPGPLH